jgi:hypothetical protein
LGSGAEFVNLGLVAKEVYEKNGVRPIVTGGISTPEHMGVF